MAATVCDNEIVNVGVGHGEEGIVDDAVDDHCQSDDEGVGHEGLGAGVGEEVGDSSSEEHLYCFDFDFDLNLF